MMAMVTGDPAYATEATDMPGAMRGDLSLDYQGSFKAGGLTQDGQSVGLTRAQQHDLILQAEFAPVDGLAFFVALPQTLSKVQKFPEAYEMVVDPATNTGAFTTEAPLGSPPEYRGKGSEGVWLGAAIAPFSERYDRNQQVSWRLDVAYRTRAKNTFWEEVDGKRGVSTSGSGFKFKAAFSTQHKRTSPYLVVDWLLETRRPVTLAHSDGSSSLIQIVPGNRLQIYGGIEILLTPPDPPETDSFRAALDLLAGFGYRSWSDGPSGFLLPDILDASQGIPVTQTEHLTARTGMGILMSYSRYAQIRLGAQLHYATPHRLEHVYPVTTSVDTLEVVIGAGISAGYR